MADYPSNPGPESSSDNYGDSPDAAPAESSDDKGMDESPRGLLPKSILMGKTFKPGDEIVLKIDAIHDDEVEVSYAPAKKEGAEEMDTPPAPSEGGGSEMSSMME